MTWPLLGLFLGSLVVFLSDEFTRALEAWHPLVFSRRTTPRSAKRFPNRVRYYAMRQRDLPEERRLGRLAAWAAAQLRRQPAPAAAVESVETVPEHVLVGLSARDRAQSPRVARRSRFFKDPQGLLADQRVPATLQLSGLGLGRDLRRYREPFARLSAGIRA